MISTKVWSKEIGALNTKDLEEKIDALEILMNWRMFKKSFGFLGLDTVQMIFLIEYTKRK